MNNMVLNELYNKIIDLDFSEYTHQKLYDLCFKLDDEIKEKDKEIERLNSLFYLFILKLEHILKWGVKKYYKENIKFVIEEMKRLKGDDK